MKISKNSKQTSEKHDTTLENLILPASNPYITFASTNLIEQSLAEIWCQTLNISSIATTDSFFEIGGDSLLALVVIEQMKQRLGWEVNLGDLLRAPTINDLINLRSGMQQKAANLDRIMIRMTKRGQQTPIIFLHPVSGLIFAYSKLVRKLSSNRGCYGLQATTLVDLEVPSNIEQMANNHADAIYNELGEDEFNLFGWSAGGIIAYEIAKIAADKNLNLQKLFLFDSYMGNNLFPQLTEKEMLIEFRNDLLAQVFQNNIQNAFLDTDSDEIFRELAMALFGSVVKHQSNTAIQFVTHLYEVYKANMYALTNYQAQESADVSCIFLHTPENNTVNTWREMIKGEFINELIDCDHYGLLKEQTSTLIAECIKRHIDQEN